VSFQLTMSKYDACSKRSRNGNNYWSHVVDLSYSAMMQPILPRGLTSEALSIPQLRDPAMLTMTT
jgi:hypothetical protein